MASNQLLRAVDEVLHYRWDPCGVAGAPEARDEYHAYVPTIYSLLRSGAQEGELVACLAEIEAVQMGLSGNREGIAAVVAELIGWREYFSERCT
jgi:hypothetical protein